MSNYLNKVSDCANIINYEGIVSRTTKVILGTTPMGRDYFGATVGRVTKEMIRNYIANPPTLVGWLFK